MELKPSSVLIGVLIVALASLIALNIASNYSERYGETLPTNMNWTKYDIRGDTQEVSDLMRDKMIGDNQTTDSSADFVDSFLKSTWEALKLSFSSLEFASDLGGSVSDDIGAPSYLWEIGFAIMVILFIFTIISAFFKIKGL